MENTCNHLNFGVGVEVSRIVEDDSQPDSPMKFGYANIRINCTDCGEPFHFRGVDYGLSPNRPMLEVGGLELRAPIRPGQLKMIPQKVKYEVFADDNLEFESVS